MREWGDYLSVPLSRAGQGRKDGLHQTRVFAGGAAFVIAPNICNKRNRIGKRHL